MNQPAKYLVVIESGDGMVARLFDAQRRPVADFDASSFEVVEMTAGQVPTYGVGDALWGDTFNGHSPAQRDAARVYTLAL